MSYGLIPMACSRPYAAYISTSAEVIGGTRDGQQGEDDAQPEHLAHLGLPAVGQGPHGHPQPDRADDDRRPDQRGHEPLVGLDDAGRQVPRRQEGVARTEGEGDRGRAEEPGQQGQRGRADDADQGVAVVAMPDRRPVDRLGRLGRVARPALRRHRGLKGKSTASRSTQLACHRSTGPSHRRSRLSSPPPASLSSASPDLAASRGGVGGHRAAGDQGPGHVPQLLGPVQLTGQVAAGGPVPQLDLDLLDPQAGAQDVDGHADLHTPSGGQRTGQLERPPGQAALTGQRGPRGPAGQLGDAPAGGVDHQAEPARRGALVGDLGRQHGDGQVGAPGGDRGDQRGAVGGRLPQVGVEQQQGAALRPGVALLDHPEGVDRRLHRGGLAPVAGVGDHDRPRGAGVGAGPVAAAVVADDHQVDALAEPGRR